MMEMEQQNFRKSDANLMKNMYCCFFGNAKRLEETICIIFFFFSSMFLTNLLRQEK